MTMTRQAPKVPHLAALLSRHQDDIATTWAEMAHELPGTRYAEHSVAEIRSWLAHGVAAAVETLSTGSYRATEEHLRALSRTRLQMGFDISEVTEGLLLLKKAFSVCGSKDQPHRPLLLVPAWHEEQVGVADHRHWVLNGENDD
jgi:hypothetical protein